MATAFIYLHVALRRVCGTARHRWSDGDTLLDVFVSQESSVVVVLLGVCVRTCVRVCVVQVQE